MELTVTNLTLSNIVLNSELGSVGARKTVVLSKTRDEIDRSIPDLDRLSSSGIIRWSFADTAPNLNNGRFVSLSSQRIATDTSTLVTSPVVLADTRASIVSLVLPESGVLPITEILVVDCYGAASTFPVQVTPNTGQTINGSSDPWVISTNFGYLRLLFDGSNWTIIGRDSV